MEIACARVVAESLPIEEYFVFGGSGERGDVGEAGYETHIIVKSLCNTCLLEDNLADPDAIRVGCFAPREDTAVAFVPVIEGEKIHSVLPVKE